LQKADAEFAFCLKINWSVDQLVRPIINGHWH
jgi:hypothetical protein